MIGAQALIRTLTGCGVDVCFSNPGTSEMHFVAALDDVPEMRGVLCLFEGAATGAADGYGRMTGRPAAALLHLGPGLANGLANLHNARRAHTPLLVVAGDHATWHKPLDPPLESDIDALAGAVSAWVQRPARSDEVAGAAASAVAAAMAPPGGVATLILPADVSWSGGAVPVPALPVPAPAPVTDEVVGAVAAALRSGEPCVLLLGGEGMHRAGLEAASRVAQAGARMLGETFPSRHERGAGLPAIDRLAYLAEFAVSQLGDVRHLILAGARAPVSFFAYPGKPSWLAPAGCQVHRLAEAGDDVCGALTALADLVAPGTKPVLQEPERPALPDGELTAESAAAVIGALLPEGAIVSDEANTSGLWLPGATAGAPPHDWLTLTGGAIGQGLPCAVGAALACPGRRVIALQADGSALYTLQSLWTLAREGLDALVVLLANRRYRILQVELARAKVAEPGPAARALTSLAPPEIDWVGLARALGVPAARATTVEELDAALRTALAEPGPRLVEAVL